MIKTRQFSIYDSYFSFCFGPEWISLILIYCFPLLYQSKSIMRITMPEPQLCLKGFEHLPVLPPSSEEDLQDVKISVEEVTTSENTEMLAAVNLEQGIGGSNSKKVDLRQVETRVHFPFFIVFITVLEWWILVKSQDSAELRWYLAFNPVRRYEIWRYFTNMFTHTSWIGLVAINFSRFTFGLPLETVHGSVRVGFVYIFCQVFATLIEGAVNPSSFQCGSCSAEWGLIMATFGATVLNWRETSGVTFFLWFTLLIFYAVVKTSIEGLLETPILGHASTLAGTVGGLLIGLSVLKVFHSCEWKTKVQTWCINVATFLTVYGLMFNILYQLYYNYTYTPDVFDKVNAMMCNITKF